MAMDVGALTPFFHAFRERELINDIMEETCGARLTMNYIVPGGVMFDLHPNFVKKVKDFVAFFRTKIDEYDTLVTYNVIFQERMKGVGVISAADAISFGCTGPVLRACGVKSDIRKLAPYDGYDKLSFEEPLETARGEFGVYIISEGGLTPYRIHFRSPGFANLSALPQMAKGQKIGDLVAMMGTLDLVIPDIDR